MPMPMPASTVNSPRPDDRRQADQHRTGGAGKTDMGKGVPGKGFAAQHQEIADGTGDDAHDAGARGRRCA